MALRFSSERIDATGITPTGAGGLRIPGVVTRSGVFSYTDSAGNTVREWRPPEEVLKADSIASMRDLPVTIRHPKVFVDPATWSGLAIGHVSNPRADEVQVAQGADIVISAGHALPKVGKDLKEISYGYKVRIDATPGIVPEGMPDAGKSYDVIQRDIIGNHVALGPTNWGRQGSSVSLRLDSAGDELPPAETHEKGNPRMFKIRIDGKDFSDETEVGLQAKVDAHTAAKAQEATNALAATEKARADAADKAIAKLNDDLAAANARADAAPALLAARVKLEGEATKILGNSAKFDGKTDREIRVESIKKFDSAFDDKGMSDDAVSAAYGVWAKVSTARADASTRKIAGALGGLEQPERKDGQEDPSDADAAKRRRDSRNEGQGFTYTKEAAVKGQASA